LPRLSRCWHTSTSTLRPSFKITVPAQIKTECKYHHACVGLLKIDQAHSSLGKASRIEHRALTSYFAGSIAVCHRLVLTHPAACIFQRCRTSSHEADPRKRDFRRSKSARVLGVSFASVNRWEGGIRPTGQHVHLYLAIDDALRVVTRRKSSSSG